MTCLKKAVLKSSTYARIPNKRMVIVIKKSLVAFIITKFSLFKIYFSCLSTSGVANPLPAAVFLPLKPFQKVRQVFYAFTFFKTNFLTN